MRKSTGRIKRAIALFLVVLMSIESFAAVVSDNDGAAFITKAEFDSLKNEFQSQINKYNESIDNKIDGMIANYLSGIKVLKTQILQNLVAKAKANWNHSTIFTNVWQKDLTTTNNNNFRAAYCNIWISTPTRLSSQDANTAAWTGGGSYVDSGGSGLNYDDRLFLNEYNSGGENYYYVAQSKLGRVTHSLWFVSVGFTAYSWTPSSGTSAFSDGNKTSNMRVAGAENQTFKTGGKDVTFPCYHTTEYSMIGNPLNILYVPSVPTLNANFGIVGDRVAIFDGEMTDYISCANKASTTGASSDGSTAGFQPSGTSGKEFYLRDYKWKFYQNKVYTKKPQEWLNYGASIACGEPVLNGNGIPVCQLPGPGSLKLKVKVAESGTLALCKNKFPVDWNWTGADGNVIYLETISPGSNAIELNNIQFLKDDIIFLKFKPTSNNSVAVEIDGNIEYTEDL